MVFMLDPILISKNFVPFVPFVDKSPNGFYAGLIHFF